jgi:hypothetical protein
MSFYNNRFEKCGIRAYFQRFDLINNEFENNYYDDDYKSVVYVNLNKINSSTRILNNTFKMADDKKITSIIQLATQENQQQLDSLDLKLNFNKFLNITSNVDYILSVDVASSSIRDSNYTVDARFNYWLGKTTLPNIQRLIRDNFYDQGLIKADFGSFYEDESLTKLNNKTKGSGFQAGRQIGGYLSENFELNADYEFFNVVADMIIDENATLTLNPAVALYFNQTYSIICNGHLIIRGNSSHKVKFHVLDDSSDAANKLVDLIVFSQSSNANSTSRIEFLEVVSYSRNLNSILNIKTQNSPEISQSSILNSNGVKSNFAIYFDIASYFYSQAPTTIRNVYINGFKTGLRFNNNNKILYLDQLKIENCSETFVDVASSLLQITSSSFLSFAKNATLIDFNGNTANLTKNSFNSTIGSNFYSFIKLNTHDVFVKESLFYNTLLQVTHLPKINKNMTSLIDSNRFICENLIDKVSANSFKVQSTRNKFVSHVYNNTGMFQNSSEVIFFNGQLVIDANAYDLHEISFRNNYLTYANLISPRTLNYSFSSSFNASRTYGSFKIDQNQFLYNEIHNQQNSIIILASIFDSEINSNKFDIDYSTNDNATNCPLSSYPFRIPTTRIKASFNYFGRNQIDLLQNCLVDLNSNSFDYEPIYDESLNLISNYKPRMFIKENKIIEGYLTQNQTLTCSSLNKTCEFRVLSNLIIPKNLSLTIQPGCSLMFASGSKILVEGSLIIEGSSSFPVVLGSSQYWSGIENYGYTRASHFTIANTRSAFLSYDSLYLSEFYFESPSNLEFYSAVSIKNADLNKTTTLSIKSSTILNSLILLDYVELEAENFSFNGNLTMVNPCKVNIQNSNLFLNKTSLNLDFRSMFWTPSELVLINSSFSMSYNMLINFRYSGVGNQFQIENSAFQIRDHMSEPNTIRVYSSSAMNASEQLPIMISNNRFSNFPLYLWTDDPLANLIGIVNENSFIRTLYPSFETLKVTTRFGFVITNNQFINSTYKIGLFFELSNSSKKIAIKNNKFIDNLPASGHETTSTSIQLSGNGNYEINNNLFIRNRELAYDLGVVSYNLRAINASFNYWNGFNDTYSIESRINDPQNNLGRRVLVYQPFLVVPRDGNQTYFGDIECSKDCSGHGICISDDRCKCSLGYKGITFLLIFFLLILSFWKFQKLKNLVITF